MVRTVVIVVVIVVIIVIIVIIVIVGIVVIVRSAQSARSVQSALSIRSFVLVHEVIKLTKNEWASSSRNRSNIIPVTLKAATKTPIACARHFSDP